MRTCLVCLSTYADEVHVCPVDGSKLDEFSARLEITAAIAPPPGALLPFASLDDEGEVDFAASSAAPAPHGDGSAAAMAFGSEEGPREGPRHHPDSRPGEGGVRAGAPSARAPTSELERHDFSMIISSNPGEPELASPESRIGKVYGSYRLLEVIGRGGMGCVYRAEHVKLGRDVALKLLREDYAQRRDAVMRFFQEARAVNLIRHRNIVDVIDYVELDDGIVFIIMEFLAGHSLGRLMRETLEVPRALAILAQICDGLAAAHAVGIVHRDLKPDNIIVVRSPDGGDLVKILDFGVAKLADKYASGRDLTAAGAVIGTPAFMSPEQAGGLIADARSDVYSLGAIMYQLFTREPLFRASSFDEFVRQHLNDEPIRPSDLPGCEDFDPVLEATIMRCLEKNPETRFTVTDLRTSLLALLASLEAQESDDDMPSAHGSSPAFQVQPTPAPTPTPAPSVVPLLPGWRTPVPTGEAATSSQPGARSHPHEAGISAKDAAILEEVPEPAEVGDDAPTGARDAFAHRTPPFVYAELNDHGDTPLPAPFVFDTPSPYSPPAAGAPLPGVPETAESQDAVPTRARRAHTRLPQPRIVGAAVLVFAVAGVASLIPLLAQTSDEPSSVEPAGPVAARPLEESTARSPSPAAAQPVAFPLVKPDTPEQASSAAQAPAADEAGRPTPTAVNSGDGPNAAGTGPSTPRTGEQAAAPIRVRVVSNPAGELNTSGDRKVLCRTPCTLTLNADEELRRRTYVLGRAGYKDEEITIDLDHPPAQVQVELERLRSREATRRGR